MRWSTLGLSWSSSSPEEEDVMISGELDTSLEPGENEALNVGSGADTPLRKRVRRARTRGDGCAAFFLE